MSEAKLDDGITLTLDCEDRADAKLIYAALKYASEHTNDPSITADLDFHAVQIQQQCVNFYER